MQSSRLSAVNSPGAGTYKLNSAPADNVSFVVRHRVRADAHTSYGAWLVETMRVAAAFPGHRGLQVVRPTAGGVNYTIIVNFATHDDATHWHQSAERRRLIEAVQPHLVSSNRLPSAPVSTTGSNLNPQQAVSHR